VEERTEFVILRGCCRKILSEKCKT